MFLTGAPEGREIVRATTSFSDVVKIVLQNHGNSVQNINYNFFDIIFVFQCINKINRKLINKHSIIIVYQTVLSNSQKLRTVNKNENQKQFYITYK